MRKNRILEILAATAVLVAMIIIYRADKGYYAEITPQEGYRGSVTVYDPGGDAVYKWYSASGYVLSADVADSGEYLAVACEENGRGKVHIFRLDSTGEAGLFDSDEIVVSVSFLGNKLCALTEHGAYMLSDKGNVRKRVKFHGILGDYEFSDGVLNVEVRSHMSGGVIKEMSFD